MVAREAYLEAWAFFTLRSFLTMCELTLDLQKTYAWGTTTAIRWPLGQLGIKLVEDFSELGGALTFTAAHRVRLFVQKGSSMQEKWQRLRRSSAPTSCFAISLLGESTSWRAQLCFCGEPHSKTSH